MNREEVSLQGKGSSSPNVDGMFSKHMHTHTLTHTTPRGSLGAKKALLPSIPIPSRVLADGDWLPACCEGENSGLWCGFTTWDHPSIQAKPSCGSKAEWTPLEVQKRAEGGGVLLHSHEISDQSSPCLMPLA